MYRVSRLWLASLAAVTLLLVAGCPKQPPAQSAPTTRVAAAPTTTPGHPEASEGNWGCLYEGEGGVYWLGAAAGAQPIKVLELEGEDNSVDDFAISADGARLAIVTGAWQCEIIELATGERTPVWSADKDPGPMAWSPDGNTLAYVQGGVLSVLPPGGSATVLVSDERVSAVAWSPDGSRIAYGRRDAADQDLGLFVVPAAGGKPRQLAQGTHDVFGVADIAWSPDGQRIAFMHAWEGGALCFINADGTGYRANVGPAFGPAIWLQDGSALVYTAMANEVETLGIYRCTPAGKPEAIIRGKSTAFDMLPSGRLLAISSPAEGNKQPTYVKILPAPSATAQPEWKGAIPASGISGHFQPGGSHVALWVQDARGEASLWIAPTGQAPTKRAENVKRLLGWALGPASGR
jgi:hypothetical protein